MWRQGGCHVEAGGRERRVFVSCSDGSRTEPAVTGINAATESPVFFQATYGRDGLFVGSATSYAIFRSGRQLLEGTGTGHSMPLPDGGIVYLTDGGVFRLDPPSLGARVDGGDHGHGHDQHRRQREDGTWKATSTRGVSHGNRRLRGAFRSRDCGTQG